MGLPTVELGSEGIPVMLVQSLVNSVRARNCPPDSKFRLLVDGKFGPITKAAVETLQAENVDPLLVADGVVGRMTWAQLLRRGGGLCR